jgi:predicted amidohydrolase YtcJ
VIVRRLAQAGLAVLAIFFVVSCVRRLTPPAPVAVPLVLPSLAIIDVAVAPMTGDGRRSGQTILLRGDTILEIGDSARVSVPNGVAIVRGSGLTALPGLWDMHVHALWTDPAFAVQHSLPFLLRHGIVGVRDMGAAPDALATFRQLAQETSAQLPDVVMAGPLVDGPRTRWTLPVAIATAGPETVDGAVAKVKATGADFIKPYGNLDRATYAGLARAAKAAGLPLAGHVPNTLTIDDVLKAGQRSIEHLEVVLSRSCSIDDPAKVTGSWLAAWIGGGYAGRYANEAQARARRDADACRDLLVRVAAAPLWWTPTLSLELRDRDVMDQRFRQIATPAQLAACKATTDQINRAPPAVRQATDAAVLSDVKALHDAGVKLLAGSDFNNDCVIPVDGLFRELANLVRAGLTPYEALRTATVEPAAYLGRSATSGTLEPGKRADILLVRGDPLADIDAIRNTDTVIRGGIVVNRLEPFFIDKRPNP